MNKPKLLVFFSILFSFILFHVSHSWASQGIDFQLAKMEGGSFKCEVFFNVTNSSGLNITFGNADITLLEKDGSIISKDRLLLRRIKKGETEVASALVGERDLANYNADCSIIKTIKLQLIYVEVDGEGTRSAQILSKVNGGKKSSRIAGVVVK